ncbi:MAG: septum formation initiator family protein [Clostridia bacterium]|nr:septum formation initiator family protein [Clostridia bacterium]
MAEKRTKKRSPLRLLSLILLIALLAYFGYMLINQSIVLSSQNKQIARMKENNERLEAEYQALLREIEDKNTLDYISRYMRSHFGMVEDGETRIDVVEP